MNILIIEDDLVIATNVKEHLHSIGYTNIEIATNSRECSIILQQFIPDILLVDIILEKSTMDGIDIVKQLFSDSQTTLIYITGTFDTNFRERAKDTKPAAYLIKPIDMKQLEIAIEFAIHSKSNGIAQSVLTDQCPLVTGLTYFFVKSGHKYERINKADIVALESDGAYTDIITKDKTHKYSQNLKNILERLDHRDIIRCHNSYAVNVRHIQAFDSETVFTESERVMRSIPVGNLYRGELMVRLPKL